MRIPRIYTAKELSSDFTLLLDPEPSHHLTRVLRMDAGDTLVLFNGQGGEYRAEITAVEKKQVQVRTGEYCEADRESPLDIQLGVAVSRGDRMDWIMQKSTELGVSAITPLFTERTGVKLAGARAEKKVLHWRQVVVSACEQCGRNKLPAVHNPQALDNWLVTVKAEKKLLLHHRAADNPAMNDDIPDSLALLIGPEGGLSEEEIERAEQAGFSSLHLGPRILRTETAPLAALAILQARWGDMVLR